MNIASNSITRRQALSVAACLASLPTLGCSSKSAYDDSTQTQPQNSMQVHYLEIVTTDVEAACKLYADIHTIEFGPADQNLGGARTAKLTSGTTLGIRAPMHAAEHPVTRVYTLVADIEAAVASAVKNGAEVAVPPMKIPGHGTCAIFFHGGIETGLWQL